MGFFDFSTGGKPAKQPAAKPVTAEPQPVAPPAEKTAHAYYLEAEELAQCLYGIPYMSPHEAPLSVRSDNELMAIIADSYQTTRAPDGLTQQSALEAAERIRLQSVFKERIYPLLERCLAADPEHALAFMLYPRVAEHNTRAKDRPALIALYERFLPNVERTVKGTRTYTFIAKNIKGMAGNCFDKVERYLADYHYDLARLYLSERRETSAKAEYNKACELCPQIYGCEKDKIKLQNETVQTVSESDYTNGLAILLSIIQDNPGILQTDLYKACPGIERETVSYILYFASSSGVIERTKKGRTYELRAAR